MAASGHLSCQMQPARRGFQTSASFVLLKVLPPAMSMPYTALTLSCRADIFGRSAVGRCVLGGYDAPPRCHKLWCCGRQRQCPGRRDRPYKALSPCYIHLLCERSRKVAEVAANIVGLWSVRPGCVRPLACLWIAENSGRAFWPDT